MTSKNQAIADEKRILYSIPDHKFLSNKFVIKNIDIKEEE